MEDNDLINLEKVESVLQDIAEQKLQHFCLIGKCNSTNCKFAEIFVLLDPLKEKSIQNGELVASIIEKSAKLINADNDCQEQLCRLISDVFTTLIMDETDIGWQRIYPIVNLVKSFRLKWKTLEKAANKKGVYTTSLVTDDMEDDVGGLETSQQESNKDESINTGTQAEDEERKALNDALLSYFPIVRNRPQKK